MKEYQTIRSVYQSSFIEKKSEFIGYISPATTVETAENFIQEIRKKNKEATHNVPAYFIRDGEKVRCSDDGEPQGTAGVPVLEVIKRNNLVDVVLVVTRYYGGIMLGAGGLVRAYSKAASLAVQGAEKVVFSECKIFQLEMDYSFYGVLMNQLSKQKHKVIEDSFMEKVTIKIMIPFDQFKIFSEELIELSAAQIKITELGTTFAEI